jgi:hypothetical protein
MPGQILCYEDGRRRFVSTKLHGVTPHNDISTYCSLEMKYLASLLNYGLEDRGSSSGRRRDL